MRTSCLTFLEVQDLDGISEHEEEEDDKGKVA
jgi:hypothetical protein